MAHCKVFEWAVLFEEAIMADGEVVDAAFDEWFEKFFNDEVVGTLRKMRDEFKDISLAIEQMEKEWPLLKGRLNEKAVAEEIEKQRLRPPLELAEMLMRLSAHFRHLRVRVPELVRCEQEIEGMGCYLRNMVTERMRAQYQGGSSR